MWKNRNPGSTTYRPTDQDREKILRKTSKTHAKNIVHTYFA